MELFDKKFVYLEWDDVLEGEEVFVADSFPELRRRIENDNYKLIVKKHDGDYPFVTSSGAACYAMVYYDPNYDCKRAYAQGKQIQYKSKDSSDPWIDCFKEPSWEDDVEYRVKPEKTWRPFKDIQELKDTWFHKRYNVTAIINPLEESMIWVRDKKRPDITRLITDFNGGSNAVALAGQWHILEELFDDYTFLDGSPCGVEE